MKILIVSTTPTHPTAAGNCKFLLQQVEYLKGKGHDIYFLYVSYMKESKTGRIKASLEEYWNDHLFIFTLPFINRRLVELKITLRKRHNNGYLKADDYYPNGLESFVTELNKKFTFDACIVNYYWLTKLFTKVQFEKSGIFTHDYFAYKDLLVGKDSNTWMCTDASNEAKALQRCNYIFSLNSEESIYFSKIAPKSTICTIYSTFDCRLPRYTGKRNLLFLSSANYFNVEGLKWFLESIFPVLQNRIPGVKLVIGGTICNSEYVKQIRNKSIEVVGLVDNIDDFYNRGDAVINPTRYGTGLKIKTFEGLAQGKYVLAHPHSAIGIYDLNGSQIMFSENSNDWVDYLQRIFDNEDLYKEYLNQNSRYFEDLNNHINIEYQKFLQ